MIVVVQRFLFPFKKSSFVKILDLRASEKGEKCRKIRIEKETRTFPPTLTSNVAQQQPYSLPQKPKKDDPSDIL
jgi:hypothetical protein